MLAHLKNFPFDGLCPLRGARAVSGNSKVHIFLKIGNTILQNYKKNTNVKADDEEVMVIGQRFIRSIREEYKKHEN